MMRPEEIYQRIEAKNWRHVWVVGDIHGCFSMLMKRLRECRFDPQQDLLVSVGDLIDRGPDSLGCLALLRESWMTAVRGNHEQMALDARASSQSTLWLMNGGDWFTRLTAEHAAQAEALFILCQRLPWILEVRCRHSTHVIAHADYPASTYQWQKKVDLHQVLWSRERLINKRGGISGADHFWFGHTPLRRRMDFANVHYIDTGAVFGGQLTLARIQQRYQRPGLKIAILLRRSPEAVDKILYRKTAAVANPLIVHRIKTLLLGIVDVHDNILASSIQVTYKKYQREHYILNVNYFTR